MKKLNTPKSPYFYYLLIILVIYALYSNVNQSNNTIFSLFSFYSFKLIGIPSTLLQFIVTIFPYVIFLLLCLFIIRNYTRITKSAKFRLNLSLILGVLIVIIFIVMSPYSHLPTTNNKATLTTTNPYLLPGNLDKSSSSALTSNTTQTLVSNIFSNKNGLSFNNDLTKVLAFFALLLILLILLRSSKSLFKEFNSEIEPSNKTQDTPMVNDPIRIRIMADYLKISQLLESKGINPDFSLTPVEFENETLINLQLNEFVKVTYYYELARFSKQPITEQDYNIFQSCSRNIYTYLSNVRNTTNQINEIE